MCDKHSFEDTDKPRTAEELLAEKRKRDKERGSGTEFIRDYMR